LKDFKKILQYAQDEGHFDKEGYYHRSQNELANANYSPQLTYQQAVVKKPGQQLCTSASLNSAELKETYYLHVCRQGNLILDFSTDLKIIFNRRGWRILPS